MREEMRKIVELSEYVEDIANSEGNIRSIFEEITNRVHTVVIKCNTVRNSSPKNDGEDK